MVLPVAIALLVVECTASVFWYNHLNSILHLTLSPVRRTAGKAALRLSLFLVMRSYQLRQYMRTAAVRLGCLTARWAVRAAADRDHTLCQNKQLPSSWQEDEGTGKSVGEVPHQAEAGTASSVAGGPSAAAGPLSSCGLHRRQPATGSCASPTHVRVHASCGPAHVPSIQPPDMAEHEVCCAHSAAEPAPAATADSAPCAAAPPPPPAAAGPSAALIPDTRIAGSPGAAASSLPVALLAPQHWSESQTPPRPTPLDAANFSFLELQP